jgi:hypothetical protein
MTDFEKLGQFYLGRKYDTAKKCLQDDLLLYDSKDLVTHGVCVGMTGSGKTGLCIALLEEAAIDNIPAIIIDPKGDMSNLLLTFPGLTAAEFMPWINSDDAGRSNQTPEQFSAAQAELWKKGLGDWGQDGKRIQKLKDSAEFTVYTPGSTAGTPISILNSFNCPSQETQDDAEALADMISSTATGLLGLIGIVADPIKSREHILLSNILQDSWSKGKDLDLTALITAIQSPPFSRVGAFNVDSFYPAKERFELALLLNNLLAAPGFNVWLQGDGLDVGQLLYGKAGKPRISVISIAHLTDNERMFFVTLLLNQVVSWMRSQPGTTSLRALLYMDEVAGYLPPVANPPSKKPLMILFKQARAFGVGVLLATQNPVDLDYKALANAGTWFIGRLQTQQDVDRVMQGLSGASAGIDPKLSQAISGLGKRVFLMKNIHENEPEIFQTRWCLSYLRGPLTLAQIKTLKKKDDISQPPVKKSRAVGPDKSARPALAPQVNEFFAPVRGSKPMDATLMYKPFVFGLGEVAWPGASVLRRACVTPVTDNVLPVNWDDSLPVSFSEENLEKQPEESAAFATLNPAAGKAENYKTWTKDFGDYLYRTVELQTFACPDLKQKSKPGESERDFRVRLSQLAREGRDDQAETLRRKYAVKMNSLHERVLRAQQRLDKERADVRNQGLQTAVSIGATILGAFMGRKTISTSTITRASSAMRSGMRTAKEQGDISIASESLENLQQQLTDLQAAFDAEMQAVTASTDPLQQNIVTSSLRPKKTDVKVRLTALVWLPHWVATDNSETPGYGQSI